MWQTMKRFFSDLSLNLKIGSIVVLANIILFGVVSIIGLTNLCAEVDALLYRSTADTLRYAEQELLASLHQSEQLSRLIAVDLDFQKNLNAWNNVEEQSYSRDTAYRDLILLLDTYREQLSDAHVSYVSLWGGATSLNFNAAQVAQLPDGAIEKMVARTYLADGYPVWTEDYVAERGLYLTRAVKRAVPLRLDIMGSLSFCVDIDEMMRKQVDFSESYDQTFHLLQNGDATLFISENLPASVIEELQNNSGDGYRIVSLDGEQYFAMSSMLEDYGWQYSVIVPYTNIYRQIRNAAEMFLMVLAIGLVISFVLCSHLSTGITKHLHLLIAQMNKFDASQTIEAPAALYNERKDEIGQLHRQFYHMTEQIMDYIDREYKYDILMKETQIHALEAQIDPHFLYNVLSSVTWRAKAIGETQIPLMVEALSRLLRASLKETEQYFTLEQELSLVRDYMTIQQIRFDEDLVFSCDVPEDVIDATIPKLTIQPLLENAIIYGMAESTDSCKISLQVKHIAEQLYITVSNTGSTFSDEFLQNFPTGEHTVHGLGIGLQNIQKRLRLIFGEECNMTFQNGENQAIVCLQIPYQK